MDDDDVNERTENHRSPGVAVVIALVAVVAAVIVVIVFARGDDRPQQARSPSVTVDGWSATSISCGAGSPMDERLREERLRDERLRGERGRLDIIDLGDGAAGIDELDGCVEVVPDASGMGQTRRDTPLILDEDHRYFVVPTYGDRMNVRLADVETQGDGSVRLHVQYLHPGPRCAVTDEYRGSLVLLVSAPIGVDTPSVELEKVPDPC